MIRTYPKNHDEKLSEHFSLKEFHCPCKLPTCTETKVSVRLIEGLEDWRSLLCEVTKRDVALILNSAYRCKERNQLVGGKPGSKHLTGEAVDARAAVLLEILIGTAKSVQVFRDSGIGIYANRVHVDVGRPVPTRWMG